MSRSFVLRPATIADAPAIRALVREAYAKWVPIIGREPKPMSADYAAAVEKHRIDLLYAADTLAALIEMIPEDECLLIENVAVLPAFQGQGFGRRLMAHAEQVAAATGRAKMRLFANKAFAENVRLYSRLGYRIDREEPFMGGTAVYMSKRLHFGGA
jgi:GNAT superfamily N-acetyltransferase